MPWDFRQGGSGDIPFQRPRRLSVRTTFKNTANIPTRLGPRSEGCRACRRVLRRSKGWKRSVEQVPLMEPQRKALITGCNMSVSTVSSTSCDCSSAERAFSITGDASPAPATERLRGSALTPSQQPCSPGQLPVVRSGQGGAGPCSAYGEKGHGGPVSRAAAGVILVWCPAVA